eukprot:6147812-Pyramimonas_sp.AAC.1
MRENESRDVFVSPSQAPRPHLLLDLRYCGGDFLPHAQPIPEKKPASLQIRASKSASWRFALKPVSQKPSAAAKCRPMTEQTSTIKSTHSARSNCGTHWPSRMAFRSAAPSRF